jgi:hypothetical protein
MESSKVAVAGAKEVTQWRPRGRHRAGGREGFGVDHLPGAHAHELLRVVSGKALNLQVAGLWDVIHKGVSDYRDDRNVLAALLHAVPVVM